jgi:hypothetical protein
MSDAAAVVLAVVAAAGAWVARPMAAPALGVAISALALSLRRPLVLCIGVALLASGMGARAWAGLAPPASRSVDSVVTLVDDPTDGAFGAVRADVRVGRRRVEMWARGDAADALRARLAGEPVGHRSPASSTGCGARSPGAPRRYLMRSAPSSPASSSATTAGNRRRSCTTSAPPG